MSAYNVRHCVNTLILHLICSFSNLYVGSFYVLFINKETERLSILSKFAQLASGGARTHGQELCPILLLVLAPSTGPV